MRIYLGRNPHMTDGFRVVLDDGTDVTDQMHVTSLEVKCTVNYQPQVRLTVLADVEMDVDESRLRLGPVVHCPGVHDFRVLTTPVTPKPV